VWAHSEFVKLCYSRTLGRIVDRPAATWARYQGRCPEIGYDFWGPNAHPQTLRAGKTLGIVLKAPARVHWGVDGWRDVGDVDTRDSGLGLQIAELPVAGLVTGQTVQFTFLWRDSGRWEGQNYEVRVVD
jgi:glucoamylase